MELSEITKIWNNYNQELSENLKINERLLKAVSLGKVKSLLSEFKFTTYFELVVNGIFIWPFLIFVINHFYEPTFMISGVILLLMVISGLAYCIFKLINLHKINFDVDIITTQKTIERLRIFEIRDTHALLVVIPLTSAPFIIVGAKAILNINLVLIAGWWLLSYIAGSVIVALIIVYFLKKFPDRKLEKAINFLGEIRKFASE